MLALLLRQTVLRHLPVHVFRPSWREEKIIINKATLQNAPMLYANYVDVTKRLFVTLSRQSLSIGRRCHAKLFGSAESSAVEEHWQVDNVSHVVMAIDV